MNLDACMGVAYIAAGCVTLVACTRLLQRSNLPPERPVSRERMARLWIINRGENDVDSND